MTNNYLMAPIRCTQNPTMSEEWRRGWHPERIPPRTTDDRVLVVGGGPAGLEAARALGERGYPVMLAEASRELGGRVSRESRLPGLSGWGRVRDYRLQQFTKLPNVETFLDSEMTAADVVESECSLVAIATGSKWRRDGVGRHLHNPVENCSAPFVLTPDDIMAGTEAGSEVVIYDDDHFYMASVVAEKLLQEGRAVTIVTPAATFASFTQLTLEIGHIHKRLFGLGVRLEAHQAISGVESDQVIVKSIYGGQSRELRCDNLVMVAGQQPNTDLYESLLPIEADQRIVRIGDCLAPATIAAAVHSGHKFARDLGLADIDEVPFLREDVALSPNLEGYAGVHGDSMLPDVAVGKG